jgi:hypothetical protein
VVAVVKDGGGWEAERGREGRRVTGFEGRGPRLHRLILNDSDAFVKA